MPDAAVAVSDGTGSWERLWRPSGGFTTGPTGRASIAASAVSRWGPQNVDDGGRRSRLIRGEAWLGQYHGRFDH